MRTRPALATTLIVTLPLLAAVAASPAAASGASMPTFHVVVSGLDNPRGLAARGESVYIAEGGHGDPSKCIPAAGICIGLNSAISRVSDADSSHATKTVIAGGLVSVAGDPSGIGSSGAASVSVRGHRLVALMGGNTSHVPTTAPAGFADLFAAAKAQLGQLLRVREGGTVSSIAGVGDFDLAWSAKHTSLNPQFPDSNPNAVLATRGGYYVVDAGANTLDFVRHGHIRILTYFDVPADSPTDAVPTCVSRGPDGALYVAELLGGQFAPGNARVWRVVPGHGKTVWATGLTAVNGCGWGPDGKFYATEFESHGLNEAPTADLSGDVVQISRNGKHMTHLGAGQLFVPSGFAAGDGKIYVSNCSIAPATGFGPCATGGQLVSLKVAAED